MRKLSNRIPVILVALAVLYWLVYMLLCKLEKTAQATREVFSDKNTKRDILGKIRTANGSTISMIEKTNWTVGDMSGLNKQIEMIFDEIARSNFWGGANETISGRGSTTYSTLALRNCLGDWIIKYNIKTIVDVPCGDANWQHAIPGIEKVTYTGYDVSQHAIDRAKKKNKGWKFGVLDLTMSIPPKADLIILRDFLQHLPLKNGNQALSNVFKSKSTWLGISTYPTISVNIDIKIGAYFRNNVLKRPFYLPKPTETCDNYYGKEAQSHQGSKFYLIKLIY